MSVPIDSALSTQVQLVSRPHGWPVEGDFRVVRAPLPELAPGQVRVANEFVSVDPYMRGRMNEGRSYVAPYVLGETMTGSAVGRVLVSRAASLPVGTLVQHNLGWRDIAQGSAEDFRAVREFEGVPSSAHLGLFGATGFTAYVGLTAVAGLRPGETVFISGAAGAVGSAAGQFAHLLGARRVIGSAGSPAKVRTLLERYGYDAAFDYHDAPVGEQLIDAAPEGIDVYFDNVGGDHLEAALERFNDGGRAALCGAVAGYNDTDPEPGPRNMMNIVTRSLTLRGFILGRYAQLRDEFEDQVGRWHRDGALVWDETVVDGIDNAVTAFLSMMSGGNVGKMVVRVA